MTTAVPDTLLLPVETLNREFDGKLLLALCAAERGLTPIIGGRTAIHDRLPSLPRSIYLSKGVRSGNQMLFPIIEALGHCIVGVDEEALVRLTDELFLMKLDPDAFPRVRILFAWGEDDAAMWRSSQWYRGAPILESGNPRTDMLRPELRAFHAPEVGALRDRFGDFVLFNSNFAIVNHFTPGKTRFKVADWAPPELTGRYRAGILGHKAALFDAFLAAMPALARAIAPRTLVIRPHPSENAEPWRTATAGLSNVTVLHQGPVVPWLIAARVLVHNGCSSAVEAAAIGTPAVSFRPVVSEEFDLALPNSLSRNCPTFDSLAEAVRGFASSEISPANGQQRATLRRHMAGLDGALCSDRIVAGIAEHRAALAAAPATNTARWLGSCISLKAATLRRRFRDRLQRGRKSAYTQHKFPGIEAAWVEERLMRFRQTLGRFDDLRVRQTRENIFTIERA